MTILIVDDEKVRHDIADTAFPADKYEVYHAWNSKEGIHLLLEDEKERTYTAILLDHDLGNPKITGKELALLAASTHPNTPILCISANPFAYEKMRSVNGNVYQAFFMAASELKAQYQSVMNCIANEGKEICK